MTTNALPVFADLEQAFDKAALDIHPSEVHGMICGILCGTETPPDWVEILSLQDAPDGIAPLQNLYEISKNQLSDVLFELQLALPSDDEDLVIRAEALTLWAQGFVTGLKLANVPVAKREPGEMTEAINDLLEIAQMNYEEVINSEEDEAAYVELVEFVRVAVILIYQDVRAVSIGEPIVTDTTRH